MEQPAISPARPGAAFLPPTGCLAWPGLSMGTVIRLDAGKISLCPFNKYSRGTSSVPNARLRQGSLPRYGWVP